MKLEGSLDAFSLPDIFQLLSFTKKTGGLHLARDGWDGVVFFTGGQVTGASADSSRQPLARRLVGSGTVDDDALAAAVEAATSGEGGRRRQGTARARCRRRRAAPPGRHRPVGRRGLRPAPLAHGDFAFVDGRGQPGRRRRHAGGRGGPRRHRVAAARPGKPSRRSCRRRGACSSMPVVLPADPQVSREEWSLLALVDGRRSVTELVDLTGSGQYAVVSTLAALVQRGLLEVRDDSAEARRPRRLWSYAASACSPRSRARRSCPSRRPRPRRARPTQAGRDGRRRRPPRRRAARPPTTPADAGHGDEPRRRRRRRADDRELATAKAGADGPVMLGGAHVPQDVVPPRPEPFLPKRQADFEETRRRRPRSAPMHVQAGPSARVRPRRRHRRHRHRTRPRCAVGHRARPQRQPQPDAAAHRRREGSLVATGRAAAVAARQSRSSSPARSPPARRP